MPTIQTITSRHLASLQKLLQKKHRDQERKFLIEGPHLVEEALEAGCDLESVVLRTASLQLAKLQTMLDRIRKSQTPIFVAGAREFKKISETVNSQGIVGVVKMQNVDPSNRWSNLPERAVVVALNNTSDPGNVGTIIRTCAWFGVSALLLDRGSVDIYNAKIVRSAMGALFHLNIFPNCDLATDIAEAKKEKFIVYATAVDGDVILHRHDFPRRTLVVFGNEARGVDPLVGLLADRSVAIQKFGNGESLNVAVCCGIILHAVRYLQP